MFLSLVAAWFMISSTSPLDSEKLAIHAGDLRSLSAAGALLSDQFSNGNLTETFFHEQLELIDGKVDDIRDTLETSDVAPQFKTQADQLKVLGSRVHDRLSVDQGDQGRELKALSASLKALEENLKKGAGK